MSLFTRASLLLRRFAFESNSMIHSTKFTNRFENFYDCKVTLSSLNAKSNNEFTFLATRALIDFKPNHEFLKLLDLISQSLKSRIDELDDLSLIKIIFYFSHAHEKKYTMNSPELLSIFIEKVLKMDPKLISNSFIYSFTKFIPIMREHQIDYKSIFYEYFKRIDLDSMGEQELFYNFNMIGKIRKIDRNFELKLKDGRSIFQFFQDKVLKSIENKEYNTEKVYQYLRVFIICDRGSEDFFRHIENIVFNNLSQLSDRFYLKIPVLYENRILHDYLYMINTIYKNVYDEFINRIDKYDISTTSLFLNNYWHKSNVYGLYCDDRLSIKLIEMIENKEKVSKVSKEVYCNFIGNVLSYLDHSRSLTPEILLKIYEILEENYKQIPDTLLVNLSVFLSRYQGLPRPFWEQFHKDLPRLIASQTSRLAQFYSVYLNLKLRSPEVYENLKPIFEMNLKSLREAWKNDRTNEIKHSAPGHVHKILMKELTSLKIDYLYEHYDEYFIDIALPQHKIALEILGPGHFLFPSRNMNGRTYNRKSNLEQLGWQVHSFPFYKFRNETATWALNYIQSILPMHS